MTDHPKGGRHVPIYFDGAEVWLLMKQTTSDFFTRDRSIATT